MLFQIEVTWGRRLGIALQDWEDGRRGRNRTALFAAVGELTGAKSPQTISKFLKATEPPAKPMDQQRVVVLLLALGEDVADYGLDEEMLPRHLTAEKIRGVLITRNATCNTASSAVAA